MPKPEFTSIITLQALEGKKEDCKTALTQVFDDPCVLSAKIYCSQEDPEILMAQHDWPSFGAFQEHLEKHKEHPLFIPSSPLIDYIKVTHWKLDS